MFKSSAIVKIYGLTCQECTVFARKHALDAFLTADPWLCASFKECQAWYCSAWLAMQDAHRVERQLALLHQVNNAHDMDSFNATDDVAGGSYASAAWRTLFQWTNETANVWTTIFAFLTVNVLYLISR